MLSNISAFNLQMLSLACCYLAHAHPHLAAQHYTHPLAISLALYLVSCSALFLFFVNTHLFAIGITFLGFCISFQVPIFFSWASSACMAFSHLGHSSDFLASFKVGLPLFAVMKKVSLQTAAVALTISSLSSLLEKGSYRWQ
jgi:hypothetical protein